MTTPEDVKKSAALSPELPWNQTDVDQLGPTVMKWMEDHEPFYRRWAEVWFQNFQFIYGNQGVRWSRRYGYVSSANFADFLPRLPALNQRAQTNLSRIVVEALSSMIYANLPEWDVDAADPSSIKNKRMQRIIQKLLDAYMIRLCADLEVSNGARIFTAFGQFAFDIGWNPLGGHIKEIPRWQKVKSPVMTDWMAQNPALMGLLDVPTQSIDGQGQPMFEERFQPVIDQMGKQVIDKLFAGDVRLNVLTPFEYRRSIDSTGMHNTKSIQRLRLIDYDQFLDEYGSLPGRTKLWDRVQPIYSNPAIYRLAVRHFMRMQFTAPPSGDEASNRQENIFRSAVFKNKVLVVEHYDAPHPIKWRLGRRTIICNGDAVIITVPQYHTNKLDGWHPFVEGQWLSIAPSSMSMGPMNDVVAKNKELNIADSLVATAMRRNMGSHLLVTPGKGFDPQRFTGEPGMIHEVLDVYGARWLHDDMPISPVIPQLRQSFKDDVFDVSGAGDALRGDRTPGVPSGYGQRIVEEREERRLSPPKKIFEKAVAGAGEKIIACLKANVVELDPGMMGYMIRAGAGEFSVSDVTAFLAEPLSFGVDINVEADSMHLRSKATMQATVSDTASSNPAVQQRLEQNPKALDEYLKFFDMEVLRDDSGSQRDRAQRENEQFMDLMRLGPQAMQDGGVPVVIEADDDAIHIQDHNDFLIQNADEVMSNPEFFKYILGHINRHKVQLAEKTPSPTAPPSGSSLLVPEMTAQAAGQPPPQLGQVAQVEAQKVQQAQKNAPKAPTQSGQQAQRPAGATGPRGPATMGAKGPPPQAPGTPAANMPAAKRGN